MVKLTGAEFGEFADISPHVLDAGDQLVREACGISRKPPNGALHLGVANNELVVWVWEQTLAKLV